MAKGVDSLPLDRWNSERSAYQTVYAYNNTGYGSYGSPALAGYGFQDLAYYGGFFNAPGYGLVWQPYGASSWIGWDPYISGAWAFTPGFGYAWASAYPWGWLPYHYGAWGFTPGIGWFWAPGNSFGNGGIVTAWQPSAPVVKGPPGYIPSGCSHRANQRASAFDYGWTDWRCACVYSGWADASKFPQRDRSYQHLRHDCADNRRDRWRSCCAELAGVCHEQI